MRDAGAEVKGCAEVAECLTQGVELEIIIDVRRGVVVSVFAGFGGRNVGVGWLLGVELGEVPASDTGEADY